MTSGLLLGAVPSLDAVLGLWARHDIPWQKAFVSALIREVRVKQHPVGVPITLTRITKQGETDEDYAKRVDKHRARVQRERLIIDWRT